jgi:methylated-DNA-[protein]-cysteine S-methyltransferase
MTTCAVIPSPIGPLSAVAREGRLVELHFGARPAGGPPQPVLADVAAQLREYFAGTRREFDLPLALPEAGTLRDVCAALAEIPYGETVSYGEVTARIGLPPGDVRRVGALVGRNPIPVVIPCHRVIGADGSLTGFGGGLPRKAHLLDLESGQLRLDLAG